jgi:hypothetical protein
MLSDIIEFEFSNRFDTQVRLYWKYNQLKIDIAVYIALSLMTRKTLTNTVNTEVLSN